MEKEEQQPRASRASLRSRISVEQLSRWSGVVLLLVVVLVVALSMAGGEQGEPSEAALPEGHLQPAFPTSTSTAVGFERSKLQPDEIEQEAPQAENRPAVEGGVAGRPKPSVTSEPMVEPGCAIITEDRVRLRESPGGAIRALANTGLPVMLLMDRADVEGYRWAKIKLDSVERWVAENFVQPMPCG